MSLWEIPENYPSLLDHKLILLQWENLPSDNSNLNFALKTGWNIQNLLQDKISLKAAKNKWDRYNNQCLYLIMSSSIITRMLELEIDGNLIQWTRLFLIDRKFQLVIDKHTNKEKRIKTGIAEGSLVSLILFLIYISGVFK